MFKEGVCRDVWEPGTPAAFPALFDSRATVTRGANNVHVFVWSFRAIRTGIGLVHWKRVDGSKWEHCLQQ